MTSSKSKNPSTTHEEKKSSSSKHHKKDKKDKKDKHKHHKSSHKSKEKPVSNGIEIPSDINPNYKPPKIRHFPAAEPSNSRSNGHHFRPMAENDDDALANIKRLKSQKFRTAVYSGKKTSAFSSDEKFPSLSDLCIHVMQDHVHLIDQCGDAPFDLLKPVLERAKPNDLMRIEEYNPRLTEDTGK